MSQEITLIREYLNSLEHDFRDQPIFRMVFANDQFEYREGDYNEFKGDLYVRTVHGVKHTYKYPLCMDCWIIEQLFDLDKLQHKDIKEHNGYECIYAFKNAKTGRPLTPLLKVAQLVIKAKRHHISGMLRRSMMTEELLNKDRKEYQHYYDAIDPSTDIQSALHFREAISLAGLEIPK